MKNRIIKIIISFLITILVPVGLIMGSIRIILNPWYPKLEYHMPWFPPDDYGFTRAEREHYALIALQYLNTKKDIHLLMDLHFPSGQTAPPVACMELGDCTLMFNVRELQHMTDVKYVLGIALPVGYGVIGVLLLFGIWAWRGKWWENFLIALQRGGWLMIALLITLIGLVLGAFDWFFTLFHEAFFAAGTWQFYTSDTLIRLFPERFWMDTFILVGGLAGLGGLLLIILGRRRYKSD